MNCLTLENEEVPGAACVASGIFLQEITSCKAKTLRGNIKILLKKSDRSAILNED